jgi:Mrp family chromosome partitioning ATPase
MNVSSNNDTGAQTTIVQQEVVALNDQMALARADAAGARAGLNAAQQQLRNGGTGETVGAAIESPVIAELRRQYAEASRNVASMETIYGPDYPDLVGAKSERDDIAKQIHEQVDRILSSLQSQASVAEQRMASIQASLNAASAELAAGNVAAVQLADLQRTADSANSQYQAFLASANAVNGQNVVAHPDARISTPASVPVKPSFPIMILDAAVGLVLGAIIGAGVAFVLDQWSANSATMEDVERNLGVAYAGALPTVKSSVEKPTTLMPINAITAHPLSSFAESFRNLAAFLFYSPTGEPVKVLAVASALPKEGKTTTAIKVLLMDCDLRRRSATEAMSAQPKIGLIEVLDGKATLEQALQIDKPTGAYFLPLTPQSHLAKSPFESKAMDALLARLRGEFDVIVLDTAPVLAVVDTRMLARKVDAMVMLVTWRATPSKAVRAAIHLINSVGGTVTGAALTMVNLKAQSQSGYGDPSAYYNDIKGYYSA